MVAYNVYRISRILGKSAIEIGARRKQGMDGPDRRGYLSCVHKVRVYHRNLNCSTNTWEVIHNNNKPRH